jgi:hypothetical protein
VATASTVQAPRGVLHTRGNWSARDDRVPSAVWLAILWFGMIAGFGTDIPQVLKFVPPPPRIIWVHGAVFTMWMVLLTVQVLFVLRDRVAWHRAFGWFVAGWAALMAVMGPWVAVAVQVATLNTKFEDTSFLALNLADLVGFLALLAWGIALRRNPAAHRRMMILSTVALADPGFARFIAWLWPINPPSPFLWFLYTFYGNILLIILMAAWDWWRGRLLRSFAIGAAALVASEVLCAFLYYWPPWKTATVEFVRFCAKHSA